MLTFLILTSLASCSLAQTQTKASCDAEVAKIFGSMLSDCQKGTPATKVNINLCQTSLDYTQKALEECLKNSTVLANNIAILTTQLTNASNVVSAQVANTTWLGLQHTLCQSNGTLLSQQISGLNQQVSTYASTLTCQSNQTTELNRMISTCQNNSDHLKASVDHVGASIGSLNTNIQNQRDQIKIQKGLIQELTNTVSQIQIATTVPIDVPYGETVFRLGDIVIKDNVACEWRYNSLSCAVGEVINILSVTYGRLDHYTCGFDQHTNNCAADQSIGMQYVTNRCQNQTSCTSFASYQVLSNGDPCPNVNKYAQIFYTCILSQ